MSRQHDDDRLRHERSLELAARAVDFDLTSADVGDLQAHLATCLACARRAAAMRADAGMLSRPLTLLPSPRVDAAVLAAIARRPSRPRRLLLLAAAALLAVTLIGAVAVAASRLLDRQALPTTVLPTPTPPQAVVTPGPDASPASIGATWGTLTIPASDVGTGWIGRMEAVAVTESGFVAVGRPVCVPQNDPTTCHASVWTAAPGEGWTRAPDQPGLEVSPNFPTSGPEPGMLDVATGPAGVVAIGYALDDELGGPRIWQSPDGRTWQRNPFAFGPSGEQARFSAIAASSRGYVIVGWVFGGGIGRETLGARAAAWISPDGVTWRRAADTERMDVGPCIDTGEEPMCGGMRSVVPSASGFVAVGFVRSGADPAEPSQPAAWTSSDGLAWKRSDAGLDFKGTLSGVTAGGPGLIAIGAVGTICQPDCGNASAGGVAATTVDGSTWSVERVTGAPALERVVSAGSRSFALGVLNPDADSRGDLQLWSSDDGVSWLRVPGLPSIPDATSYRSLDIAAADDRLVVVGWAEVSGADFRRNFAYVSPPVGSAAAPTASPRPTPTARPAATPSPTGPVATSIDPVVLLRVEIRPDVSVGRFPSLTVYRDGSVLRRDDSSGRVARLTPTGLDTLLASATASELLATSGAIGWDPAYAGGFTLYSIDVRRGSEIVHRSTTNVPPPDRKSEANRIITLAVHLDDLESWLPADAWAIGPASATTYVASDYLLKVTVFENQPGVDYPPQPLDVAQVEWPLGGRIDDVGDALTKAPLGAGSVSRCGLVTLAEAAAVQRALAAAPLVPEAERIKADLTWADSTSRVTVSLAPLLPDDPRDCAVDATWP